MIRAYMLGRFYAENCIFVHMTDQNFPVTGPIRRSAHAPTAPQMEVLEPPLGDRG